MQLRKLVRKPVDKFLQMMRNYTQVLAGGSKGIQKQILEKSLDYVSGLETEQQNPDKLLDDKNKDLTLYDLLLNDDKINGTINMKKRLVLSVGGDVVPASDDPKDVEVADFVSDCIYNMYIRWWDVFDNLLDGWSYGFKCGEKCFDVIDSKVKPINIKFMHSVHFDFDYDEYGKLDKLIIGKNIGESKTVEGFDEIMSKFMFYINPYLKDGSYYGESDLRQIYFQYYSKYQIMRFRNIYLQNYGQPIPIVRGDKARVEPDEKTAMINFLENLQDNMYLYLPGMRPTDAQGEYFEKILAKFEIDFLESKHSNGTDQYDKTIDQIDSQIARKLLVPDRLGFTSDKSGSRAQSEVYFDLFKMILRDVHGRLEDVANSFIKQIVDYNFNVTDYPTWQFEKIDEKVEHEMLKVLIDSGIIDKREKWIRKYTGIPELSEKEEKEIEEAKEEARKNVPQIQPQQFPPQQTQPQQQPQKEKMKNAVNFKLIKEQYDTAEADFVRDYNTIHKEISENLIKQIERKQIIENKDLGELKKLEMKLKTMRSMNNIKKLLSLYYAKLYVEGKAEAIEEVKDRMPKESMIDKKVTYLEGVDWLDREWIDRYLAEYGAMGILNKADIAYLKTIRDRAFFLTGDIEQRILKDVHSAIINGLDQGLAAKTIINQIDTALANDRKKYATTIARTNASDAYNTGRMNFFTGDVARPLIEAYQYSAILDNVVTEFCESHDGQIIYPNDPQLGTMSPPNHFNCRSLLIPVMVGESDIKSSPYYDYENKEATWGTNVNPKFRLPAAGFGGVSKEEGGW